MGIKEILEKAEQEIDRQIEQDIEKIEIEIEVVSIEGNRYVRYEDVNRMLGELSKHLVLKEQE